MASTGTGRLLIAFLLTGHVRSSFLEPDNSARENIVSSAIVQIVSGVRSTQISTLHFTKNGSKHNHRISAIVDHIHTRHTYTIEDFNHISDHYPRLFNIVLINGEKEFCGFLENLNPTYFDPRGHYIILVGPALEAGDRETFSKTILKAFFELHYDNVIVLFRDKPRSTVFMYTFLPCDRTHACYEVVPFLYNTFDGKQFARKTPHFPEKWKDFNGCPITVGVNEYAPHVILKKTEQAQTTIDGVDIKILQIIASFLNFTIVYKIADRGLLYSNGTGTGLFGMLLNGEVNLLIGGYSQNKARIEYLTPSVSYLQTSFVYALPVSLEFGSLERHFFPLKKDIWIVYFALHCSAFIFLTILKRFRSKLYSFVVGGHSRSPCLDMFQMFFGVAIHRTPRYTFARTLFGIWLLSTFVLSSSYRGRLVEILTSRSSRNIPQTIAEFSAMRYEIYIRPQLENYLIALYGNDSRIKVSEDILLSYLELQVPSGRRRAILDSHIAVNFFNANHHRDGFLPMLPERLQIANVFMYFQKDSYFAPPFNHGLWHFSFNGLINKWIQELTDISGVKKVRKSGPERLQLAHFEGTFELYAIVIGISMLVFVAELVSLRSSVLRRIIQFYTE